VVLLLLLAAGGYALYSTFRHVTPFVAAPGCEAGTGTQAVALDNEQASIAATIAGVAERYGLSARAVTIAYATAMQESKMHDLDYGDLDSVGVFQQRPSEGWGTTAQLEDPVYATTKFFAALERVPGYKKLQVYQAAQDVQRSADGAAYQQYTQLAADMATSFTGTSPRAVWCWYSTPLPAAAQATKLSAAGRELTRTFGGKGRGSVGVRVTTTRSGSSSAKSAVAVVQVRQKAAWAVASWLVTHADSYGISDVRYAGYEWQAAAGGKGWQRDSGSVRGSIVVR
jgi:hypothetical protein